MVNFSIVTRRSLADSNCNASGVDIVDVGGESTRPGATRVDPKLEADRIAPVIEELVAAGIRVSVDTMRASVAAAAIEAGAGIVNDVSGWSRRPRHGLRCGRRRSALDPHALALGR